MKGKPFQEREFGARALADGTPGLVKGIVPSRSLTLKGILPIQLTSATHETSKAKSDGMGVGRRTKERGQEEEEEEEEEKPAVMWRRGRRQTAIIFTYSMLLR